MLLTIKTTGEGASDIGYLLHKHPDRFQTFSISCGQAHVFYPQVSPKRCTAALLLDVDPVGLVRRGNRRQKDPFLLRHYVNDRPYVASSFMSTAIAQVLSSALNGKCSDRPDLLQKKWPLTISLSVLPCRGGREFLNKVFQPLGYKIRSHQLELDENFPDWGDSHYFKVELKNTLTLQEALSHLYVLIPVFDNEKHYWVGKDEVEKLLSHGKAWLSSHPQKALITKRYLRYVGSYTRIALAQLIPEETEIQLQEEKPKQVEEVVEEKIRLHDLRLKTVAEQIDKEGCSRVLDLGCGGGKLLKLLLKNKKITQLIGMDVSLRSLEIAHSRLKLDMMPERQRKKIQLVHGSLMYRDKRIEGFEAAALVEVIEHLDIARLKVLEKIVFGSAEPGMVVVTTPNIEYNAVFGMEPGQLRHNDHRFEWSRDEFKSWAQHISTTYGYDFELHGIGPESDEFGTPSQMGVFRK